MLSNLTYHCASNHIKPLLSSINFRCLSLKVAVVGSGPAGFYTTQKLLRNPDVHVDIYEKLPVPFGLVRYGVAPDHPEVKNVMKSFTTIANNNRVKFYGNISLGEHFVLDDLVDAYHAVVLCYGSAQDKLMNIPGELTTKNTISARSFVGWYNGLPEDKDLNIDLNCDTACIIGNGNVALDCARILLKPSHLEKTDITSYAQNILNDSKIRRIYILGRRGPFQASFTTKELRELTKLNEGFVRLEPKNLLEDVHRADLSEVSRVRKRLAELFLDLSTYPEKKNLGSNIELIFKFLAKPIRIIGDETTGKVSGLELQRSQYLTKQTFLDEQAVPSEEDEYESLKCGLIIRSIGYKSVMIDKSLPMNHKLGAILNTNGRINGHRSIYCSGWLATGASGVIAGTLNSSQVTAQTILDDIKEKNLPNLTRIKPGFDSIEPMLQKRCVQVVRFDDWLRIDELERRLGESKGKTREKLVAMDDILEVVKGKEE